MILFGFGSYFALFSHSVRLHLECNTHFSNFGFDYLYDESTNGVSMTLEVLKVQLYLSISSNIQDLWFNIGTSEAIQNRDSII